VASRYLDQVEDHPRCVSWCLCERQHNGMHQLLKVGVQRLASLSTDLPEFLDLLLVVNAIDSMHIKIHQVHIGL